MKKPISETHRKIKSSLEGFKLYFEDLPSMAKIKRRQKPSSKLAVLRKLNRKKKPHRKTRRRASSEDKHR